jgi:hypothetical protein
MKRAVDSFCRGPLRLPEPRSRVPGHARLQSAWALYRRSSQDGGAAVGSREAGRFAAARVVLFFPRSAAYRFTPVLAGFRFARSLGPNASTPEMVEGVCPRRAGDRVLARDVSARRRHRRSLRRDAGTDGLAAHRAVADDRNRNDGEIRFEISCRFDDGVGSVRDDERVAKRKPGECRCE